MKVSTLFLDIGGVLLTNGWDRFARQRAAKTFNFDFADMDERHHLSFDTYEEGKLSLDDYLSQVVFYQKRPFTRQAFKDFMFAQSQAYPEMLQFIERLKEEYNLKIATVSNEGRELTMYRIQKFDLKNIIDFFVSSCFVHYRKPDADIYKIALDIAQVSSDEVIYIEDRELFVEEAGSLGIRGIKHTELSTTRAQLASLGLI